MEQAKIDELMTRTYAYELVPDPDEGGYFAYHPDLEGCFAQGDSADEAIASLDDARRVWFEARLEERLPIPRPLEDEPSGRFSVRVPRATHGEAVRAAARQGVSLNQLINVALSEYLGATRAAVRIDEGLAQVRESLESTIQERIERFLGTIETSPEPTTVTKTRWEEFTAVHHAGYRLIQTQEPADHRLAKNLLETLPNPLMSTFFRGLAYSHTDPVRGYELCLRAWRYGLTPEQASLVLGAIPESLQLDDLMKDKLFKTLLGDQDLVRARQAAPMLAWCSRQRRLTESAEYYNEVARDPEGVAA